MGTRLNCLQIYFTTSPNEQVNYSLFPRVSSPLHLNTSLSIAPFSSSLKNKYLYILKLHSKIREGRFSNSGGKSHGVIFGDFEEKDRKNDRGSHPVEHLW